MVAKPNSKFSFCNLFLFSKTFKKLNQQNSIHEKLLMHLATSRIQIRFENRK